MIRALIAVLLLGAFTPDQKASLSEAGVVRLQYVGADHWAIDQGQTAKALRTSTGERWLLINMDADQADFDQWFLHEMAHHIAWERHGESIDPHGPEFRAICRQLVTRRQGYFCRGD